MIQSISETIESSETRRNNDLKKLMEKNVINNGGNDIYVEGMY